MMYAFQIQQFYSAGTYFSSIISVKERHDDDKGSLRLLQPKMSRLHIFQQGRIYKALQQLICSLQTQTACRQAWHDSSNFLTIITDPVQRNLGRCVMPDSIPGHIGIQENDLAVRIATLPSKPRALQLLKNSFGTGWHSAAPQRPTYSARRYIDTLWCETPALSGRSTEVILHIWRRGYLSIWSALAVVDNAVLLGCEYMCFLIQASQNTSDGLLKRLSLGFLKLIWLSH